MICSENESKNPPINQKMGIEDLGSHKVDYAGIFTKHICKKLIFSTTTYFSLVISTLFFLLIILGNSNTNIILALVVSKILSILPNILGFVIGAYAIVIGTASNKVVEAMSSPGENGMSYFQFMSSHFSSTLVIQCLVIILAYVIDIVWDLQIPAISMQTGIAINYFVLYLVLFLTFYSLFLIKDTILAVFNYGQSLHALIRRNYIDKKGENHDNEN